MKFNYIVFLFVLLLISSQGLGCTSSSIKRDSWIDVYGEPYIAMRQLDNDIYEYKYKIFISYNIEVWNVSDSGYFYSEQTHYVNYEVLFVTQELKTNIQTTYITPQYKDVVSNLEFYDTESKVAYYNPQTQHIECYKHSLQGNLVYLTSSTDSFPDNINSLGIAQYGGICHIEQILRAIHIENYTIYIQ